MIYYQYKILKFIPIKKLKIFKYNMSFDTSKDFQFGMKYDLSNLTKSCLIDSFSEFKSYQTNLRNYLIHQNEKEKQKNKNKNQEDYNDLIIYDIRIKDKHECRLDFSEENIIPKGYFCYPLKGSYFQKSSFEMNYFPILPLKLFKEGINAFDGQINLAESYESYPCLLEKDFNRIKNKILMKYYQSNEINKSLLDNNNTNANILPVRPANCTNNLNKNFIIWSFIQILKGQILIMDEDFQKSYSIDKNRILIPIIEEMSKYLSIDSNILYYLIISFLKECNKNLSKKSLKEKGITYKKYNKYWCRICNKFFCAFHFKIKVKNKYYDNNNIRTSYEYFKKIQITLRPPEYLFKEQEENDKNKKELKNNIWIIINKCERCKNIKNNFIDLNAMNEEFNFDESLRFSKMGQIKDKEDFFVLCKIIETCYKIFSNYFDGYYKNEEIFNFYLNPCVLRIIMHNKYDCNLLRYLIRLMIEKKYLKDINLYLSSTIFSKIIYENLSEENLLFFNNSIEANLLEQKYTDKGEKKIIKIRRNKTTVRLQVQSDKNLYYKPCDHYPAECTPENCACAKRGMCLKYCCCFKKQLINLSSKGCQYMFLGCQNHPSRSSANCSKCDCSKFTIECVPGICSCGDKCTNNNITLGKRKKLLYGYSSKIKGGGLFAGENIEQGDFVDIYRGEMVEKEELDRLSVFYDQTGNNYPFGINDKFDYVAIKCGGLTRYINHGDFDEENLKADKILVNGVPYIAFYACKDIKKYEELFYNYSYDKNSMPDWMMEYNKKMKKKKNKEDKTKNQHQNKNNKKNHHNNNMNKKGEKNKEEHFKMKHKEKIINLDEDEEEI